MSWPWPWRSRGRRATPPGTRRTCAAAESAPARRALQSRPPSGRRRGKCESFGVLAANGFAGFLSVDVALVLQNAIHVAMQVERHANGPGTREHLRVLHRGLVGDDVGRRAAQPLDRKRVVS